MRPDATLDLFAGPGGWDEGMRALGIHDVLGIEWEPTACATAEAAGHRRLQADIAALDPRDFRPIGKVASPPCTKFSAAGSGVGTRVLGHLADGIRAIFAGIDARAAIQSAILPTCLAEREAAHVVAMATGMHLAGRPTLRALPLPHPPTHRRNPRRDEQ